MMYLVKKDWNRYQLDFSSFHNHISPQPQVPYSRVSNHSHGMTWVLLIHTLISVNLFFSFFQKHFTPKPVVSNFFLNSFFNFRPRVKSTRFNLIISQHVNFFFFISIVFLKYSFGMKLVLQQLACRLYS